MENYFDLNDDTGDDAEPKPLALELHLKQQKLAAALTQTLNCPTLVAVQEVETGILLDELALLAQMRSSSGAHGQPFPAPRS